MKFSIIVPAHNAQRTIGRCAASLLEQNVADKEILLIDDHSDDETAEICRRIADIHPEIRFFPSVGRGVSAARNTGLQYATGEIIGFCDSDDAYEPYTLELVREAFLSSNADAVAGGIRRMKESKTELQTISVDTLPSDYVCSFSDFITLSFTCHDAIMWSCCNKFFKKALLQSVKFDETLTHCEDMHFIFTILSHHPESVCKIVSRSLYRYIVESSAYSATRPRDMSMLFEQDGTLRYVSASKAIQRDCVLTDKQLRLLKDRDFTMAVNALWYYHPHGQAYQKQMALIKSTLPDFLRGNSYSPHIKLKCMAKLALMHMTESKRSDLKIR